MKYIKYFIEFVSIISLFIIFKIIGPKNASNLGSILGMLFGPMFRSRKIVEQNIKTALGDLNNNEKNKIINGMWSNIGRTFAEYIFLKKFKDNTLNFKHIKISGIEHLENIKSSNKPVVFFSGHFANFELMTMELEKFGIKCAAIYRPLNNIFLNPMMEYLRMKYICPNQVPKGRTGMRELISKFKNGYSVALMVDQRVSEGERQPFFKKPAHTTTLPAQIALKYNCKLVPIFLERVEGLNFQMTVHEPYSVSKTGDVSNDTKNITIKINELMEKMVIKNPSQWIWSHNRWK